MSSSRREGNHIGIMKRWQRWLNRSFPVPYQVHPFALTFLDPKKEAAFSSGYNVDAVFLSRLALISGLFVYALFGVLDYYLLPEQYPHIWLIRFGIGVPVLALAITLSFFPGLRTYFDWVLLAVAQVIAVSLVTMLHIAEGAAGMNFISGLLLLLVFNFVAFRMRVWVASLSGLLVIVLFLLGALFGAYGDPVFLVSGLVFLFSTIFPLMFGATISELFARKHFVQSRVLDRLANTDALTGLPNRRAFISRLKAELSRHNRYGAPFAVAMADADHFKRINDEHGHDAGDQALRELGRRFQAELRDSDLVARLGGEEFAVILSETDAEVAVRVCERIRQAIAEEPIALNGHQTARLSISIGLVTPGKTGTTVDDLLKRADDAMYRAKGQGRNQVLFIE